MHTVLVLDDGSVRVFGKGDCGMCEVPELGGHRVVNASCGFSHTVLLLDDGSVRMFGDNF